MQLIWYESDGYTSITETFLGIKRKYRSAIQNRYLQQQQLVCSRRSNYRLCECALWVNTNNIQSRSYIDDNIILNTKRYVERLDSIIYLKHILNRGAGVNNIAGGGGRGDVVTTGPISPAVKYWPVFTWTACHINRWKRPFHYYASIGNDLFWLA